MIAPPRPATPSDPADDGRWRGLDAFDTTRTVWEGEHRLPALGPDAPPSPWPRTLAWPDRVGPAAAALDIETTGLGGAGSMVFQVGVAWRDGDAVRVRQLVAPDLGYEAALLERLDALLEYVNLPLVTYNGDAFDLPFLRARARFAGVRLRVPPALDLLAHARRLYRDRDGSCRLSNLEATRLGHARADDLPGALVPHVYYEALRLGEPRRLEPILRHNAWDLVATLGLFWRIGHDLGRPPTADAIDSADLMGLSRSALAHGETDRAIAALEACLAAAPAPHLRRRALWHLNRLYRLRGDHAARHALWQTAAAAADASVEALVEWAKILEHEDGDLAAAHGATATALARLHAQARLVRGAPPPALVAALGRRLERLERRIGRQAPTGA